VVATEPDAYKTLDKFNGWLTSYEAAPKTVRIYAGAVKSLCMYEEHQREEYQKARDEFIFIRNRRLDRERARQRVFIAEPRSA
jgi:hypothetical protein